MTPRLVAAAALAAALGSAPAQPPAPQPSAGADKARDLLKAGRPDDALRELQAAAKGNPKLSPPRVTLAVLMYQAGQGPQARVSLEQAAAEDPTHPEVFLLNAGFASAEGRVTDAALSYGQALQLAADPRWDPDQRRRYAREARLGLARTFEARGNWPAAKEQLAAVLADDPKNGPVRQRLAAAAFALGKPDEAYAELQAAHRDDPATDPPELGMATLARQADPAKAEDWYKKAVAAAPRDPKPARAYAGWLLDAGRAADANTYLQTALQADPGGRETLALRGLAARYRKDFGAAEGVFEGLHRDHPNDPFAAWNLALVLAESPAPDKRRRAVEVAEAEFRRNRQAEALAVLGWCLYRAGRVDDAEKALAAVAAAGQMPSRDAAYFLARVLADRQRWADAARVLRSAADAKGGFVYRADADALRAELDRKAPKDDKKP